MQFFDSRWTEEQLVMHFEAGRKVDAIASRRLSTSERNCGRATRHRMGCAAVYPASDLPRRPDDRSWTGRRCERERIESALRAEAAMRAAEIKRGDVLLMDMWAKLDRPRQRLLRHHVGGILRPRNRPRSGECFQGSSRCPRSRDCLRERRRRAGSKMRGFEVDDVARDHIREQAASRQYFFHRTGHSIGNDVHGSGANMDNLETHDVREIIPLDLLFRGAGDLFAEVRHSIGGGCITWEIATPR